MKLTQPKVFDIVWKLSGGRSFISGLPLTQYYCGKFHYNIFAHCLSKSKTKYPFFELYIGNVFPITPREHKIIDHGHAGLLEMYSREIKNKYNGRYVVDWNKWDEKESELIELYNQLFPKMKNGIIWKYSNQEVMDVITELNKGFI